MVKELDDIAIQELKETFDIFDKDKDGFLQLAEFKKVVRCSGLNPSEEDFNKMKKLAEIENKVTFSQFLLCMQEDIRQPDSEDELVAAFKVFDELNAGSVEANLIKQCLKEQGEKLSDKEVSAFDGLCKKTNKGEIDYRDYVYTLIKAIK